MPESSTGPPTTTDLLPPTKRWIHGSEHIAQSDRHFTTKHTHDNIFTAPDNAVLIHACNCVGHWGAGVAKAFLKHYPTAHDKYQAHCFAKEMEKVEDKSDEGKEIKAKQEALRKTALLIEPQEQFDPDRELATINYSDVAKKHWIGCVFTSWHWQRGRMDEKPDLKANVVNNLIKLLKAFGEVKEEREDVGELHIVMINAGKFGIDWAETLEDFKKINEVPGNMRPLTIHVHIRDEPPTEKKL